MKNLQLAVLFILTSLYITAQNPNRKFESFINYSTYVEVKTNDGVYRFQPYGNEIIETSFIPNGESFNTISHAVVLNPEKVEMKVIETSGLTEIKMKDISVKIGMQ